MKNTKDQNIISLLHTNAEEGMSLLMEEHMGLLWSACRLYLENPEDIRECVQETLLDFYEHLNRFDINKGTLKAYLYVIAKRKAIYMASKNGMCVEEMQDDVMTDGEDWVEQVVDQATLETALAKLNEQDSQMIRMKYYNGMTCAEIAHEFNLPVETVKKRQQRNLKKLRRILVAILVLGLLSACAVTVIYRYRFSPMTGFQQDEGDIWYTMENPPMVIQTEQGEVMIRSVVWKEMTVYAEFEFANNDLSDEEYHVKLYWEESERTLSPHLFQNRKGEDTPAYVICEYYNQNARETLEFHILGEKYTVNMQPLQKYEDFDDIGSTQTHNGRTIVLKKESDDETEKIKAYTYSEDVWQISGMGNWPGSEWKAVQVADDYYLEYTADNLNQCEEMNIDQVRLVSDGESPVVSIEITEDYSKVNIPFTVGEDRYCITEIRVGRGTRQYYTDDENGNEIQVNGDQLFIYIEPVDIEENTVVYGVEASLGTMESSTFTEVCNNEWDWWCIDENYEPTDIVIRLPLDPYGTIMEHMELRINHIAKMWHQNYHFELK